MAGEVRRLTQQHAPGDALIGVRLRAARQRAGLTLAAVAEQAGLTKGFLSRLERDEVSPSVASLVNLCAVLRISVGELFEPARTLLVRSAEAPAINFGGQGVREVLLTPSLSRQLQVIRSLVAPGGGGGDELYSLNCEVEFVYVVSGALRLELDRETVDLAAGDAFSMPGSTPHTWCNASTVEPCEVLWALAPAP